MSKKQSDLYYETLQEQLVSLEETIKEMGEIKNKMEKELQLNGGSFN